MKRIHSLRRQGLLLMSLGIGILLGKTGLNESIIFFLILMVIWLFSYDYAVENQFGRRKNNAKRSTESSNPRSNSGESSQFR